MADVRQRLKWGFEWATEKSRYHSEGRMIESHFTCGSLQSEASRGVLWGSALGEALSHPLTDSLKGGLEGHRQ